VTLRATIGRVLGRSGAADAEIAPPELGGLRLVVPAGYAGVYGEGYEPEVAQAISRLVEPGMVCADVGAHIGFFAFLMADRAGPEGRVVAFEASPENAAYVRRSAERNAGAANVDVRHAAVTDGATATIELFPGRSGGEMEWTISREFAEREDTAPTARQAVTVPAVRLDEVFGPGERLDVVKMDIEGGEAVALPGAERLLAEQRPVFVVEFHREVGWPGLERLIAAGYAFEDLAGAPIATPTDAVSAPYQLVARPR
jgi:FkbM family methyltransferase